MYRVSERRPFGLLDEGQSPKSECIKIDLDLKRLLFCVFYCWLYLFCVAFIVFNMS
jgi:hypothetical protein